jgi:NADH-quinone oxidoreductase subunit K
VIPLSWYLILAALMFTIGLYGVLARKNAVAILMGIELMLNAVNVNLISFWRYLWAPKVDGQVFVAIVLVAAAAEAVVGLALIISAYRRRNGGCRRDGYAQGLMTESLVAIETFIWLIPLLHCSPSRASSCLPTAANP